MGEAVNWIAYNGTLWLLNHAWACLISLAIVAVACIIIAHRRA